MPGMSPAPTTLTDAEHEAEVAKQAEIEAAVDTGDGVSKTITTDRTPPAVGDEAPVEPEAPAEPEKVKLVPTDEIETYPASVSLVGLDEEIVFAGPDDVAEVTPQVAEQVTYIPGVAVAE